MSNFGSPIPSPIDIDTPDSSILGVDIGVDNMTQYPHQWDEKQLETIQDYSEYYYNMLFYVEDLEKEGPVGKVLPKKPKGDLKSLLGENKKVTKSLSGQELHKYLVTKVTTNEPATCPKVSEVGTFTSLENILDNLKSGYKMLKKQNAVTLDASIDYGDWLNVAFELHSLEKLANKITLTWKEWLEANVGIQDSYARKLREIAKTLGKYPHFRKLGLSFSEVYQRRKQIQSLLTTDKNAALYWQQAN
jgi:hypothetical protein